MIASIINTLQEYEHLGGGKHIEIAKGKNEYITTRKDFKRKIRRVWRLKRK